MRVWCWMAALAFVGSVAAGCGGEVSGGSPDAGTPRDDAGPGGDDSGPGGDDDASAGIDAPPSGPSLEIVSPADGSTHVRDDVVGMGEWAATIEIAIEASGVASVDLLADGSFDLGTITLPATSLSYDFMGDGMRTITAIGRDAAGAELVRDEIAITITAPADTSCHAMLDALGLDWDVAGPNRGIADPVRVQPVIHGVRYRYVSNAEPTPMLMDCGLAPRLARLSDLLVPYGIDEVIHIGIYNYRCIGGGDPDVDMCTPSQHAYARAIDLHAFGLAGSDVEYSTETDFVITTRADSCPIPSSSEPDRVLKELACTLVREGVFQIVLTPNYNAAHRNHYHVDLTEGAMYLGAGAAGVDPIVEGLGH